MSDSRNTKTIENIVLEESKRRNDNLMMKQLENYEQKCFVRKSKLLFLPQLRISILFEIFIRQKQDFSMIIMRIFMCAFWSLHVVKWAEATLQEIIFLTWPNFICKTLCSSLVVPDYTTMSLFQYTAFPTKISWFVRTQFGSEVKACPLTRLIMYCLNNDSQRTRVQWASWPRVSPRPCTLEHRTPDYIFERNCVQGRWGWMIPPPEVLAKIPYRLYWGLDSSQIVSASPWPFENCSNLFFLTRLRVCAAGMVLVKHNLCSHQLWFCETSNWDHSGFLNGCIALVVFDKLASLSDYVRQRDTSGKRKDIIRWQPLFLKNCKRSATNWPNNF